MNGIANTRWIHTWKGFETQVKVSNNETEYDALLTGLSVAEEVQVKELLIHYD